MGKKAKKLSNAQPFSSLVGEFKFFGGAKFKKAKLKYSRFSRL